MNAVIEKSKKIIFSSSYSVWVYAVLVIAIAGVLAYFSRDISFYEIKNSADAYTMQTVTAEDAKPYSRLIEFDYKDTSINIVVDASLTETPAIYGSTRYGVAQMTDENLAMIDETFLGSFAAVYPKQNWDVDGDGSTEAVFYTVKTDLRSIQSNSSATPLFRDKNIPLEVGLDGARQLFVYFQTKVLAEREVTVHFNDGSTMTTTTDAAGYLKGISVHQIRAGVTIEYAPNAITTYYCRYMPETTNVFSSAIFPFLTLAALVLVGIIICVFMRKRSDKKRGRAYSAVRQHGVRKPKFVVVRWIIMIVSFALLTWGGTWLGYWFEELYLPVFACSKYNTDQIVSSSCYYLSHLNVLFTLPWQTIVIFFACFFIPIALFGKLFCGFVCPMGLVQDTLHVTRQKTGVTGISLTDKLYERLSIIKWTAVMLFLGMGFAGLDFCNICPVITLSPAFSGFKTSIYVSGFIMLFVLIGSFFKKRFFCNICPLGLLMGLCHPISLTRLKKDCTACTECGACYHACPMGIKTIYTERGKANITTTNCIMCGECVRNCPEDNALKLTWAGIPLYTSSREAFMTRYENDEKNTQKTKEENHVTSK